MLQRYDMNRRNFLQMVGLGTAQVAMAGLVGGTAAWAAEATQAHQTDQAMISMRQAVGQALADAGLAVATAVPATGVAKIFDQYVELSGTGAPYSFNEEVAYSLAHGAALTGHRAATVIKAHGIAKAANSVVDSLTAGVTAGCVVVVTYDPKGRHSDSIMNLDGFLKGTGIPFVMVRPREAYYQVLACFAWSEKLGLPVAAFVNADELDQLSPPSRAPLEPPKPTWSRDPQRQVLCPPLAGYQHAVLQARLLEHNPDTVPRPKPLEIPASLPPKWQAEARQYSPIFEAFEAVRPGAPFVAGDTGIASLFAFGPFGCVDACTYYGGSLPLALGALLAGMRGAWAVTGDYAFIAAGHMGLVEASARNVPLKVLVLDNGMALTTGGQPIPPGLLDRVLAGWSDRVHVIADPGDMAVARTVLLKAQAAPGIQIVRVVYPRRG